MSELKKFTNAQLLAELRERGMAVIAWGAEAAGKYAPLAPEGDSKGHSMPPETIDQLPWDVPPSAGRGCAPR